MASALATTVTRRAWLSLLLLAAAVAPVAGVKVADASKKGKKRS